MTKHCNKRMKERMGIKSEAKQQKIVDNALTRGKSVDCFTGKEKRYLEGIQKKTEKTLNSRELRVYQNKVFIFDGDLCVTILHLPKDFGRRHSMPTESRHLFEQDLAS